MPAQAPFLPTFPAVPVVPGVPVFNVADLEWNQLLYIVSAGSLSGVVTLASIFEFFQSGAPISVPVREEDGGQAIAMTSDDYMLIVDTAASASNSTVSLPEDPGDGDTVIIKLTSDVDIAVRTVTVSAPDGELINGAASLVMQAAWMVVKFTFFGGVWYTT